MLESKGVLKPTEPSAEQSAEAREPRADGRWNARIAAAQQRLRWEQASARREHAITDQRLILQIRRANGVTKRAMDFALAAAGLLILVPGLVLLAAAIFMVDRQSPLYGHTRVGRKGRDFTCWKFRSMRSNGDAILAAHFANNPEAVREWNETRKLRDDPRITKLGHFIRKTSLDELPQLFNVLMGDMSLIGPRPVPRDELLRYGKDRRYYLVVRPGITGLWQVSGRSDTSYERRVQLDREYVENWSFVGDLSIMVRTVPAVLAARGAA